MYAADAFSCTAAFFSAAASLLAIAVDAVVGILICIVAVSYRAFASLYFACRADVSLPRIFATEICRARSPISFCAVAACLRRDARSVPVAVAVGVFCVPVEAAGNVYVPEPPEEALPEEDFLEDFFPLPVSAAAGAGAVRMAHCGSCFAAARSILAL